MKKKLLHYFKIARIFFREYRAMFFGILIALLYVAIRSGIAGRTSTLEILRDFIGGYLLVFGALHVTAGKKFTNLFGKYDLLAQKFPPYALIYPYLILGMGVFLHINKLVTLIEAFTVLIFAEAAFSMWRALKKKTHNPFHVAIGPRHTLALAGVFVLESLCIALLALIALYFRLIS